MSFLNANIGPWEWYVDNRFVFNTSGASPCVVFGVSSREGKPLEFHIMLQSGAVYWRVPINALRSKPGEHFDALGDTCTWDCFSDTFEVCSFDWLQSAVAYPLAHKTKPHRYLTTIDWTHSTIADQAGEIGHKCAHLLSDDDGIVRAYPNNKILWSMKSWAKPDETIRPAQRQEEQSVEFKTSLLGSAALAPCAAVKPQAPQAHSLWGSVVQLQQLGQDLYQVAEALPQSR